MQSRQVVCALAGWRLMCEAVLLVLLVLGGGATVSAQVNTATLSGTVFDPQNLAVRGAKLTLTNAATGATRTAVTDDGCRYNLVGLPPGHYEITVDAGTSFAIYQDNAVILTVGEAATLNPVLQLGGEKQSVMVTAEAALVETQKTDVSSTINSRQITNLPINERNYINFTLLNSQSARDVAPSIGAAPTSGLNFGGQRARSNAVNVDGMDAVDNSVNGIRSTLSQEGVQEFQIITNGYEAEFGRASGGVVNIISKSGTNDFHGSAFGYLRNRDFQAQNPFTNTPDPAYTRVQA